MVYSIVGRLNGVNLFSNDEYSGFVVIIDGKDKSKDSAIVFDKLEDVDNYLWHSHRISVIDFPYYQMQIQQLKEKDEWNKIYEKYKIRTA